MRPIARWIWLAVVVGAITGLAVAAFLLALDAATAEQIRHPWLLYLLPAAGALIGWLYHRFGGDTHRGHNLILDELHGPGVGLPRRMAPLILLGTVVTHFFGGSAGREGTAVQMGASLTAWAGRFSAGLQSTLAERRLLLLLGIAAGFGAVFGTPIAGAVFAVEVLAIGHLRLGALPICVLAAIVGHLACIAVPGVTHTAYTIHAPPGFSLLLLGKIVLAGAVFGLVARGFAEASHGAAAGFKRMIPSPIVRPIVGGAVIIALVHLLGTRDYLGLGLDGILRAFEPVGTSDWAWFWKILFTVITLGSGFKGGEVTPLFFIGATLGHALAGPLGVPVDLLAALGFVAIFAAAANTPIACAVMGLELFGPNHAIAIAVACYTAYLCSGHRGIYTAQRIGRRKWG